MAIWKKCPDRWLNHRGPVLFLDRDGVVIDDRNYLSDPENVELVPGAAFAMGAARKSGYALLGVSNQSGLGRGLFGPGDFDAVMKKIEKLLSESGSEFDGFYYCPHAPDEKCICRKPGPGLLAEAAESCTWDPLRSWVVGDKASDVALGRDHGLGSVLVRTGYGKKSEDEVRARWEGDPRVLLADDLASAWVAIQATEGGGSGR